MNMRKIAVVGSFAAGAALAFAPLASADDLTSTVDSEISSLNSIFLGDTGLAGVPSTDVETSTTPGVFDIINPADVGTVQGTGTTPFDYLVYGVDPKAAGLAGDPGAYNVYNGALTEFDDAYNSELYGALNNNELIPATDLIGSSHEIGIALGSGATDMSAATTFFDAGLADLAGFFGDFGSVTLF